MKKVQGLFPKLDDVKKSDLMHAYASALQDEDVKELVSHIKLDDETLMSYTSLLEESAKDYHHCKHCECLASCQNKITGYAYMPQMIEGTLTFAYQACRYQKEYLDAVSYLKNMTLYGVPNTMKQAQMKDIYKEDKKRFPVIKWMNEFIKTYKENPKQKGMYLHGNFGSGKTYLIAAMFHEFAKRGVRSAILFWPEYLRDLKVSFQTDYKEKVEAMKQVPLLLIDDIGAESMTPWARDDILCPILQYRMEASLPTFFTSNLDLKALEEHLSVTRDSVESIKARRIIERVKQLTIEMSLVSANLRKS